MAQRRILHKLYLTAFWLLAAFALVVSSVQAWEQARGYQRDREEQVPEWVPPGARRLSPEEVKELGLVPVDTAPDADLGFVPDPKAAPRFDDIDGTLVDAEGRPIPPRSGWDRLGECAFYSGASLIPLLLLVAVRRWVLWLLRPEAEPNAAR